MNTATFNVDSLLVEVHSNRSGMGAAAADAAAGILRGAIERQGSARIIVASAPSQNELIAGLVKAPGMDWSKVTVFHMDEYVGVQAAHPASFRNYQQEHLLSIVSPKAFHGICGEAANAEEECLRYAALLAEAPIDLVCMGVGENGHIAFNDPPVADFADPQWVKIVELDEICRQQQVNDGCFPDFDAVPKYAITLTCPALMSGKALVCVVPGPRKADAVAAMLGVEISTSCPASILRRHAAATLHLDVDSAAKIDQNVNSSGAAT
jgi:glucosamine-6-phosphate deaminase